MRTVNLTALRSRVAREACSCGQQAQTFAVNADEVVFNCYRCVIANRPVELEKTRAAARAMFPEAFAGR